MEDQEELQQLLASKIGYQFSDGALMLEALTHKSYFNEQSPPHGHNERLEFLGDAVLDLIISQHFMKMLPKWPEGHLTRYRAALVNEDMLARVANRLGLGELIFLGKGEDKNNGREKPSILSDCVEAIVGAIFLDSDFYVCNDVVLVWFAELIREVVSGDGIEDAKTALQQKLQARNMGLSYNTVGVTGPDHDRTYEVEILVSGQSLGRGLGKSKKEAEKQAAQNSLQALEGADDEQNSSDN